MAELGFGLLDRLGTPSVVTQNRNGGAPSTQWWGTANFGRTEVDATNQLQGFDTRQSGATIGMDQALRSDMRWGVAVGLATQDTDYQDNLHDSSQRTMYVSLQTGWEISARTNLVLGDLSRTTEFQINGDPLAMVQDKDQAGWLGSAQAFRMMCATCA